MNVRERAVQTRERAVQTGSGGGYWQAQDTPEPPRMNWWLRLTSSGWDMAEASIEQRERARRSRLVSWVVLGLLIAASLLLPIAGGDSGSLVATASFIVGLLIAAGLNRAGWVNGAGGLLVILIDAGLFGAVLSQPHGIPLDALPAYDLLATSVVVGATVLPRASAFVIAALNSGLIILDFSLQPHFADLQKDIVFYGSPTAGAVALLGRPIALQVFLAVVAYLWVRGTDAAIRRADRAEELATLEHAIADQKRQLDFGVQQILQTHVRAANGDFGARAPLGQDNLLWQIAASLNNLLARLQRAGQAEYQLRRTDEELRRLAVAIDDAQAGRRPIWPAPSGTPADLIIERIMRNTRPAPPSGPGALGLPDSVSLPAQQGRPRPAPPSGQNWSPPQRPPAHLPPEPPMYAPPAPPMYAPREEWPSLEPEPLPDQMPDGRMPDNPWIFPPDAEEQF